MGNLEALLSLQANPDKTKLKEKKESREANLQGKVNKYIYIDDLKMTVSNVSNSELYTVRMMISRSCVKISLLQTDENDASNLN